MQEAKIVESLGALAQPQRLRAFRALVVAGPEGLTPSMLAGQLRIAPNALSFHLKTLAHAKLVTAKQNGRNLIYRANFRTMNSVLGYLTEHCCEGATCEVNPSPASTCGSSKNVLFLCTHNSARSILAEATLNHLGRGRFKAFSAGSSPHENQEPNPLGLQVLRQAGIPVDGLRSKSWDEFAAPGAPHMDLIITVCDNAAGEVCPIWPGHPATAHWGYSDPSEVQGSEAERLEAFRRTLTAIRHRLELMLALAPGKLARNALQQTARELARGE